VDHSQGIDLGGRSPGAPPLVLGIFKRLDQLVCLLGLVCLVAIITNTVAAVFARYVFNSAFLWTEELGAWLFTWMIFIGTAAAHRGRRHISIDLFTSHLSCKFQVVVKTLADAVVAFTTLFLVFSSFELVQLTSGISVGLKLPSVIQYMAIPVTGLIGILYLLLRSYEEDTPSILGPISVLGGCLAYWLVVHVFALHYETSSPSLFMAVSFFITLIIGVPVAFCMLFAVFVATSAAHLLPPPAIVMNMAAGVGNSLLLAIPLFLTAGYLMNSSGLTKKLVDFAHTLVGHMRGGLAQVNVVTSAMFGAISGSSVADAAGTTKMLVPEMTARGYPKDWSCAVTAASSILSNVFPPAISMLVFASVANVSVGHLFIAGIIPGFLLVFSMMAAVHWMALKRGYDAPGQASDRSQKFKAFIRALPAFVLPVVIIGGIRFGIVTPTEAGGVAAIWALGAFIQHNGLRLKTLCRDLIDCALDAASLGLLIAVSTPFAWVLMGEGIPQAALSWLTGITTSYFLLMLLIVAMLLIQGMIIEITAGMLIAIPMLLPLIDAIGVDRIHFAVILIITMLIGSLTPPVGLLVFVSAVIARVDVKSVFREIMPFIVSILLVVLLLILVPSLVLFLPNL